MDWKILNKIYQINTNNIKYISDFFLQKKLSNLCACNAKNHTEAFKIAQANPKYFNGSQTKLKYGCTNHTNVSVLALKNQK